MATTPKAESVTEQGEPDGWIPQAGFRVELEPGSGATRLTVSVTPDWLQRVHLDLIRVLDRPLSVLYRQVVDRRDPKPQGAPPRDFVAVDLDPDRVVEALAAAAGVVWHDARCELWVRGGMNEQIVLDPDGVLYCYPDDPAFRDVLAGYGLHDAEFETLVEREGYAKHWFHAENDELEAQLIETLGLTEMPPQR